MAKVTSRLKQPVARHFIRAWRNFRGLSMEQLAERVGLTHGAISQLERGLINYTQPTLEALAEALNCEPADLLVRDPLIDDAPWSLNDHLRKASPAKRREIMRVVDAMLEDDKGTGTEG